jgi:hypothetical protein
VAFVRAGRTVHELSLAGGEGGVEVEIRTGPLEDGALEELGRFGVVEPGGAVPDHGALPGRGSGRFRLRMSGEPDLPGLTRMLVRRGVDVYELKTVRKSLEAWFLEVMGDEERPG